MMGLPQTLTRLGFDTPRLSFNLRTALAAFIGLLVAWLLGLEHPQWAAMTVWAASQPVRGQLLEKSVFRLAGTVVGTIFGVALVALSGGAPVVLVIGLALWLGFCAGAGNVVRGFLSYGTMLAGYSAAMVALLDASHPQHVVALGLDRFLTVAVGVVTALAIGWIFAAQTPEDGLAMRVRRVSVRLLGELARELQGSAPREDAEQRAILSELADIDDVLEAHGAGSLKLRRSVRAVRTLILAEVSALLCLKAGEITRDPQLGAGMMELALAIEAHAPAHQLETALNKIKTEANSLDDQNIGAVVSELVQAIGGYMTDALRDGTTPVSPMLPVLHRDWVGAGQAAVRAAGAILAVGIIWIATGWSIGPFMMLGVSVMASLFSTADNPIQIVRYVFVGQIFGAMGAIALRWLAWPHANSEVELVLMMLPFMLVGPFIQSHRKSAPLGFDYCMVLLLLSYPVWPLSGTFGQSLAMALAVTAGPLIALVAYWLIFPTNLRRRRETLIVMMIRELETMAGSGSAADHSVVWRSRLNHRVLRLVRWTDRLGGNDLAVRNGGLAVLALGNVILHIEALLREPTLSSRNVRILKAVLRRLKSLHRVPASAGRVLDIAAARLVGVPAVRPELFRMAALGLASNEAFFRRS